MPTIRFECPYCGDAFSDADDLDYIRSYKACPSCEASFDDDDLEDLDLDGDGDDDADGEEMGEGFDGEDMIRSDDEDDDSDDYDDGDYDDDEDDDE